MVGEHDDGPGPGSRQLPSLTPDELASVRTPEQACREEPAGGDDELCGFLASPRAPSPLDPRALFLGPKGENADLLERLLVRSLHEVVAWRRRFHPEDLPVLAAEDRDSPAFAAFWAGFEKELSALLSELQADVPVYSPRYLGHFVSDTALPALVAYVATLFYNPNNVSWEASPITTLLELEVGRELAAMFGFGRGPDELSRTWGHLTGGGTVANLEALWVARSTAYLGIAVREAALEQGLGDEVTGPDGRAIASMSCWELANLGPGPALDLRDRFLRAFAERSPSLEPPAAAEAALRALASKDVLTLGDQTFAARCLRGEVLGPPVVLATETMHYGWRKLAQVTGLGAGNIVPVPIDGRFRLEVGGLRDRLRLAAAERRPVLMVVTVAGSTEEGAVDPVGRVLSLREELADEGIGFSVHCDAAYGGYLAACFRRADGSRRTAAEMRDEYSGWPEDEVHDAFGALARLDSITVDPHKLGYVPYPAGAIVWRDGRVKDLLSQAAPYVFGGEADGQGRSIHIGRHILEGSKPGAAAAAVCLSHRVLPLDERGYGALLGQTLRVARAFHDRLAALGEELAPRLVLAPTCSPDTNVVDYLVNLGDNDRLEPMNELARAVFARLTVAPTEPVEQRRFIVSHTDLGHDSYSPAAVRPMLERLARVRGSDFVSSSEASERRRRGERGPADRVVVLRTTLMNPFALEPAQAGKDYLDLFLEELRRVLDEVGSRRSTA